MTATLESAVFMSKKYSDNNHSIANTTDLTLKQMYDLSTSLVSEQDEIYGVETTGWENHSRKYLSMIDDERVINLQRTKVCVFSSYVLCLNKILGNPPIKHCMGRQTGMFKNLIKVTEILSESMESRRNSSGIFSQD